MAFVKSKCAKSYFMMVSQHQIFSEVIDILNTFDNLIGSDPIYLFLVDKDDRLLWANHYLLAQKPRLKAQLGEFCYKLLWAEEEKCPDCYFWKDLESGKVCRRILKRRQFDSSSPVYLELVALPVHTAQQGVVGSLNFVLDVTDSEVARHSLQEKEQLFRSIIDSSAEAIFFLDNDDRILSWNAGAERLFGYTPEEVIGKPGTLLLPEDLKKLNEPTFLRERLERDGFVQKYETRRVDKWGREIFVDLTRTLVRNEAGEVVGSSVILKDITEQKRLEEELRNNLLELIKLNELNEILHSTYDLDKIFQTVLIAITAGEGLRFNRAFLCLVDEKQGVLKGHLAIGPANKEEAGRLWKELEHSYGSLRDIVEFYRINFSGTDAAVNRMVQRILVPLKQKNHLLVSSLHQHQPFLVRNGRCLEKPELDLRIDDQDLCKILGVRSFVVVPLFSLRGDIGVIIADNAITEREISKHEISSLKLLAHQTSLAIENVRLYNRLEERLRELEKAYQRLEESTRKLVRVERLAAIGEMSARVAHEIRNPLVSIGGLARLMEKKLPPDSPLREHAQLISEQISQLETILDNILNIARPKKPQMKAVNLHEVFHQVLLVMDRALQSRKIHVRVKFDCSSSLVLGDERLLHQAFLNLVQNSLEAMGENGELTVETRCQDDRVEVILHDTGSGIPSEVLNRVYEPFFTTKSHGTGLGLAIVREIIENHRGEIQLSSVPDRGTTVRILLPGLKTGQRKNKKRSV